MRRYCACVALALTLLVGAAAAQQQSPTQQGSRPVRFTAAAVSAGGPRSVSGATRVEITINRWSTPAETEKLITTLKDKGAEALLDALRDMEPVGTIQTPGSLGYRLRYAHQEPMEDGGRRIFLATDRPISQWEAANQPRSIDYPFTYIELRMNSRGEGEGKLAIATQVGISAGGKVVELVNYASQPVQLNEVRREQG